MKRPAEGYDEFGNPKGQAFDLGGGDEDRVRGERILLHAPSRLFPIAEAELQRVITARGMHLEFQYGTTISAALLSGYTQLWFLSGDTKTLKADQIQAVVDFVRNGNGLAIWADNDPLFADANLLAEALMGTRFSGNKLADQIMVFDNNPHESEADDHVLSNREGAAGGHGAGGGGCGCN